MLRNNTLIRTTRGHFKIKDIELNMILYTPDGKQPVFEIINYLKAYKYVVLLEDNIRIETTARQYFFRPDGEKVTVNNLEIGDELKTEFDPIEVIKIVRGADTVKYYSLMPTSKDCAYYLSNGVLVC